MTGSIRLFPVIALVLLAFARVTAAQPSPVNQVFQFSATASTSAWADGSTTTSSAYLWIPENCERLRGLLILCNNVPEHTIVGHGAIRRMCAEMNLGIVWAVPTFWNFAKGAKGQERVSIDLLQTLLNHLADRSGYDEVARVPWIPIGESGHLLMVCGLVDHMPDRCIAAICVKNPQSPVNRTVPILWTFGSGQEWGQCDTDIRETWRDFNSSYQRWVATRAESGWPLSIVIEPGTGHFFCTDRMIRYFANYIRAACRARLPENESSVLNPVSIQDGYLSELPGPGRDPAPPVSCGGRSGEDLRKPWFFDENLAREAVEMGRADWNARTPLPCVKAGANAAVRPFAFNSVTEAVIATDSEFSLTPNWLDAVPEGFQGAGQALAVPGTTPEINWICGAVEPIGKGRFRIARDRTWPAAACYLALLSDGSEGIRRSVQPLAVKIVPNKQGAAQRITFREIPDQHWGTAAIPLEATSDAGLPVGFFVESGPALVSGRSLVLTPLPPRAKYPVSVAITAWQWGRPEEPKIAGAEVKKVFRIIR